MRKINIKEFNMNVNFLIDTGADCVCVSKDIVPEICLKNIQKTKELIKGPDKIILM